MSLLQISNNGVFISCFAFLNQISFILLVKLRKPPIIQSLQNGKSSPFVTFRFGICEVNDHVHRWDLWDAVFDEGDDGFDLLKGVVQRPLGFNVDVNLEFHVSASFHDAVVL